MPKAPFPLLSYIAFVAMLDGVTGGAVVWWRSVAGDPLNANMGSYMIAVWAWILTSVICGLGAFVHARSPQGTMDQRLWWLLVLHPFAFAAVASFLPRTIR